ncbi:MAG: Xaa-Pro peptidase family protein [Gemmataceae bacterium]
MPTAAGCQARRQRLLDRLKPTGPLLLGDPLNLRYFANFYVDPFSLGADFGGLLLLKPDGHTTLYHDHRLPKSVELAHADERVPVKWYDGQSPGQGPRRLILRDVIEKAGTGGRVHDFLTDPLALQLWQTVGELRRAKDPDEVDQLRACMRATEAGHAWARANIKAGMSELDVYTGVQRACCLTAGQAVIVYGDFTVSPGSAKRGGPPTGHVLRDGETFILDYSVVIQGYRSDFTNTLVVGGRPTADQQRLFDLCARAMAPGEALLKPGAACRAVYDAVRGPFAEAGAADNFPHHAGHGLGLSHPEAPFFVRNATETLVAGDVVTLEPGLYVDGVGGVRIEHNYLITPTGSERLSHHTISLT